MEKALKFAFCIFIVIFIIQFVSAEYKFDAWVDNQNDNAKLGTFEYGSTKQISLKIMNSNDGLDYFCGLYCYYEVDGDKKEDFEFLSGSGKKDMATWVVEAPDKGLDNIPNTYQIKFVCSRPSEGLCEMVPPFSKPLISATAEFVLNPEQREAKSFIEGVLVTLNENMIDADSKIKEVELKLNEIPSNMKIGSLKSEINPLRNKHNSFNSEVEGVKKIIEGNIPDYILAKNTYRTNMPTEITSNGDKAQELEERLDSIIKTHNRISDLINSLGKKNAETNEKLTILNQVNDIEVEVNTLIENFQSGTFEDYQTIEDKINSYNSKLDELLSDTTNKIEEVASSGTSILSKEVNRLCNNYKFCTQYQESSDVKQTCDTLKNLQGNVILENEKRESNTQEEKEESSEEKESNEEGFFSKIIGFFKSFLFLITDGGDKLTGGAVNIFEYKENKVIELSNNYKEYVETNCNFEIKKYEFGELNDVEVNIGEVKGQGIEEVDEAVGECCIGNKCTECCVDEFCESDPSLYPIIFIHGHSSKVWNSLDYSINTFNKFGEELTNNGYLSMGVLLPDSDINKIKEGSWGKIKKPIFVYGTYYKGVYDDNGKTIGKEQDKSIDEYSQRLEEIVDLVLHHTGKDKVIIVSHSMGGLVSRNYIKNYGGENKVYKLVTIGTPNHGIYGMIISGLCGSIATGNFGLQECRDMRVNSTFLLSLNEGEESLVQTMAVIGEITDSEEYDIINNVTFKHDTVVRNYSVYLNGAKNIVVNADHSGLTKNEKVYKEVINFIKS